MEDVCACHNEALSRGFPVGPIQGTYEHLEEEVRRWARDPKTGGGGHGIRKGGLAEAKSRGKRVRFQCAKDSQRSELCKWECTFEDTSDGWVLIRAVWTHNGHTLLQTPAAVMAATGTAFVPQELLDIGIDAAHTGWGVKEIDELLRQAAARRNIPVTWEQSHLRSRFPLRASDNFDLTGMVETLKARESEANTGYELRCDQKGIATHIFVQLDNAMQDWANCENNVLLFDPTWGTQRSGMKLCCFTTVSASGQTVVLAFTVVQDETADSMLWSFRSFARHFKRPPAVVFTDDAASIAIALTSMKDSMWSETKHFLCTFHLAKNFCKHVRPVIRDAADYHKLNSWFWHFAKYSDRRFDPGLEWTDFMTHFTAKANGSTQGDVQLWLENLWTKRSQWMAVLTWGTATWGVHSTQRAEAVHSALKRQRLKNVSCIKLIDAMVEYNQVSRYRKETDEVRSQLRTTANICNIPSLLQPLQSTLTPYAFELVMAQFALSVSYKSTLLQDTEDFDALGVEEYLVQYNGTLRVSGLSPVTNDDGSVTSWQCNADFGLGDADAAGHIATLIDCSCQFPSVFRLPCRHVLHLHTQQQQTTLQYVFDERWATRLPEIDLRNLRSLRALPIPSAQPALRNASAPTYADRRSLLLDEFLPILDAAARNTDAFHALRSSIPAIKHALEHGLPLGIHEKEAVTQSSQRSAQAGDETVSSTDDQGRISTLLGTTYIVVPQSSAAKLEGRTVMVKYGLKQWYLANVLSIPPDGALARVKYFDGQEGDAKLHESNEWDPDSRAAAPRWSWMLLDAAPLSNHTTHPAVSEKRSRNAGRKRTARHAPAYGPTSRTKPA